MLASITAACALRLLASSSGHWWSPCNAMLSTSVEEDSIDGQNVRWTCNCLLLSPKAQDTGSMIQSAKQPDPTLANTNFDCRASAHKSDRFTYTDKIGSAWYLTPFLVQASVCGLQMLCSSAWRFVSSCLHRLASWLNSDCIDSLKSVLRMFCVLSCPRLFLERHSQQAVSLLDLPLPTWTLHVQSKIEILNCTHEHELRCVTCTYCISESSLRSWLAWCLHLPRMWRMLAFLMQSWQGDSKLHKMISRLVTRWGGVTFGADSSGSHMWSSSAPSS